MGLLNTILGKRVRDAGSADSMMLVMLALTGLLNKKPVKELRSTRPKAQTPEQQQPEQQQRQI